MPSLNPVIEAAKRSRKELLDFSFKPFSEMTDEDYKYIGFKSGLEIHQQLLTGKKLFCRCPAGFYSDHYDAEILRHMRPTLSELGEYDGTALMEHKTRKDIIYHIKRDTVCTYEMDDTPPFELNEEALDIALGIGQLYGCSMVDEIHIARKQYLDGSIPTGFQRTTIVGVNGSIPYGNRKVKIVQLGLEEDACREVSDQGHQRVYLTDRLGMPLIETVTAPDMKTPREVAEVAEILRRMVRSTGWVRTGIGAARQDVNVSVIGGTRIEIKGVPRIPHIPLLTYNEAMRQWNLLKLKRSLERRGIDADTFKARIDDITRLLRKTRYEPLFNAIKEGKMVKCVTLSGFEGLLRWQTQTDTYFSKEISDRVRVIACLTNLPNIIHSDSQSENISAADWRAVKKAAGAGEGDTVVIVWGNPEDARTGAQEIVVRAREATIGIPSETRQALRDGTNGFERILPGPDRMYPDTDLPPKRISKERLERVSINLPKYYWDREKWYADLGIPRDVIDDLAISPLASFFEKLVREWEINPTFAAVVIVQYRRHLARKGLDTSSLNQEGMENIMQAYREGRIAREGIFIALEELARSGELRDGQFPPPCSREELAGIIEEELKKTADGSFNDRSKRFSHVMGLVMKRVRGSIGGVKVAELVKLKLSEVEGEHGQ